ncbi:hypothetical protein ACT29H_13665 [Thermophagus sp. OGC60D27]|uniref:hypothetical protein n=1 Tax=Thermophagus sp. OGC60D27 TaxID=3458415 RepID=UPI004037C5E8
MKIADYKGVITYKKWFDKNFPDDIGSPFLSLIWAIAYFETGKMAEAKIYTIDMAFQNIYLPELLLDKEVNLIDMYDHGPNMLDFAKSLTDDGKKLLTNNYRDWMETFMHTDEYKKPVNKFIALNKLLKDETIDDQKYALRDEIDRLVETNRLSVNK